MDRRTPLSHEDMNPSRGPSGAAASPQRVRRVCFVTGTRAEFGLMLTTLRAISASEALRLQIVATGMHLDPRRGTTIEHIAAAGCRVDATVPWPARAETAPVACAAATGRAIAVLARVLSDLGSDVVLVVGDRVEAFAAAAAAHICRRVVAHVHGGDRALGQIDDSLRHAITKLAHVHFVATPAARRRVLRLGEDPWRVHLVGAPGVDGLTRAAAPWSAVKAAFPQLRRRGYVLVVLHPVDPDPRLEQQRAQLVLEGLREGGPQQMVVLYPNNDPGASGIVRCWKSLRTAGAIAVPHVSRDLFLGLMRDAAMLAGNSSSGIIEAASFGTPVIDIGPRQAGRERNRNVIHCGYDPVQIRRAMKRIWRRGRPLRYACANVYGGDGAGRRIAQILSALPPDEVLLRKIIAC